MADKEAKSGRPRRYDLKEYPDVKNREIAMAISVLNELAERVYDQITDLPREALNFFPRGSYLSIGRLVLHLARGEAGWVERIGERKLSTDLDEVLRLGNVANDATPQKISQDASELEALCRRVREELTIPVLTEVTEPERVLLQRGPRTARQVLMHLVWHWVYHSGHIGLTRLLWGSEYNWTLE
jgi:uncharacterized damage-inducible protein DinB